jgi:hypothetical protein
MHHFSVIHICWTFYYAGQINPLLTSEELDGRKSRGHVLLRSLGGVHHLPNCNISLVVRVTFTAVCGRLYEPSFRNPGT